MVRRLPMFHLSRFLAGCRLDASGADWPVNAQRVFLGFVAFCLFAPLVQTLYPVFGKTIVSPIEERRSANPFPSMQLLAATNGNFAAELNKWFDDRVGFRDLFIRAKNQADYTVFHTSTKVYVGADGWLFYRYPIDSIANVDAASLSALEASYLALARLLNERGIHLIVVGYPLKAAIYPEMAPPDMPVRPRGGTYDQFRSFLSTRSELTFVDAEEIIKGLKITSSELLYAKGDIHATHFAQRAVVKEIIARIAHAEGRPDIRWDEKMTLMHLRWRTEGVERNALAVLSPPREDIPVLKGFYYIGGQESDGYWNLPDPKILDRADDGIGRPFDWEFRSLPELCAARLPGMVLFGNSFSDYYWALGLHRYFCFIRRARDPISRFKLFYDTMPADTKYFIFQFYEPLLVLDTPPLK
jgi:hypothetical protein